MKKKKIYLIIVLTITCLIITGCGCNKNKSKPNQNVSDLKFYVPSDFKSRGDLRGVLFDDSTRKIFAKGDTDDYNKFMYIDVKKQKLADNLSEYIDEVNTKNINDNDIKYIKKNNNSLEIYAREKYKTQQGDIDIINFTYITTINNNDYIITISGAYEKVNEISEIAINTYNSLQK